MALAQSRWNIFDFGPLIFFKNPKINYIFILQIRLRLACRNLSMRPLFADPGLRRSVFIRTSLSAHNTFCHESWALFVKPHLIGSMKQGSPILLSNKFNLRHKKLYKRAISLGQWFTSQITSENIGCLAKTSARMKNKENNQGRIGCWCIYVDRRMSGMS